MHVPNGWTEEKLGDLFEFKNGANTEAVNYGSGIKFVNVMDIFQNDFLTCERIRESVNLPGKKADLYKLKMGDVLFNRTSETFDEIALSTVYLDTKLAIFGGFVIRGRPTSSRLNYHFCIYCFSTNRVRKELIRRGQGAIRANIGQADIQHVSLLVPPLPEQQKIAQILSTWDKAIEKLDALIAAKQKRKKALMQKLLTGKKRFAGFEEAWKKVRLEDLAEINSGGTPKSTVSEYYDGDIPWVSIADMTKHGKFIYKTERNISTLGLENSSARIYPINTVLYAMYASIGECSIAKVELTSSQAILGIRPRENLNYLYLFYYLSSLKEKIKLQGQQGTQANLNAGMVKDFVLNLPQLEEQQKIASVLSVADKEIEIHQKHLAALKEQKKGLMQQLLTGKKRVNIDPPEQRTAVGA